MTKDQFGVASTPTATRKTTRRHTSTSGRTLLTAIATTSALLVPAVPALGAAPAAVGAPAVNAAGQSALQQISAKPRPGAAFRELTPSRRNAMLRDAAEASDATARNLKVGGHEKLVPKDVLEDVDGTVHIRYERTYDGLPVRGGGLVVHERAGARTVTKPVTAPLELPTTTAKLSKTTAKKSALAAAEAAATSSPELEGEPRLVVWASSGEPRLAWETRVNGEQADGSPSRRIVVTDATTGRHLSDEEQVKSAVGNSQYSGTVQIDTARDNDIYSLRDPQRGNHRTYDQSGGGEGVLVTDTDDVWGDGTAANPQTAAVDAAYGAQQTWDFYHDRFGRTGIAGDGVGATSRVHAPGVGANANWVDSCFCMSYGDGKDQTRPVTQLDIAAHEMTHGVTSKTAGLVYSGESGGLNEASSDILGTAVEFFTNNSKDIPDYTIGELADLRDTGKPLRYMDRPSRDARSDASGNTLVSEDYWTPETQYDEVHNSSGVGNHFFYLLAEGSGKKTINGVAYDSPTYDGLPSAGIGLRNATNVWYRALTAYMTSNTDYAGARTATLQAAADLFGKSSDAYEAVGNAWAAVNVGDRYVNHITAHLSATYDAAVGQPVSRQVIATSTRPGGLTYKARKLPKGLKIDAHTGLIKGTPKKAGSFATSISIRNSAADTRKFDFIWTVQANGGDHFSNPTPFTVPAWESVESPIVVTGRRGNAPSDLKIHLRIQHQWVGSQQAELISEDGKVIQVKPFVFSDKGDEVDATYTVDASGIPANGTWKLHVQDDMPGIPNLINRGGLFGGWTMDF